MPTSSVQQSIRDRLAQERTQLANERTLLAYARTAIMLVATGATLLKVYGETPADTYTGWGLVAAGGCVALMGIVRYRQVARELE